ncbi:D-arabinose 1-dehydrogenase (NAD(P)(+)) ARA2 [Rhodotorula paludigena]|uniref:D-arabinose 1-dehydrogenase (NAD(P)(+)) ARA2 n=1 Tax=Rhodotorula paludigena TaxID=86838 RepID=UPI0031792AA4
MASDLLTPRYPPLDPKDGGITEGPLTLPPLVLGAGVYGFDYNNKDTLESSVPEQAVRLAFRYGLRTLDTSPYYTTSEQVLGHVFDRIRDEFPRESYQIITKIGRYGRTKEEGFDYSPERIRASVKRSMELMRTDYLDGVYAHDVEFVSEQLADAGEEGFKVGEDGKIRDEDLERWGLRDEDAGTIRGPGDEKILAAFRELFALKKEGVIRAVGFSGYPMPTLLRLARLIAHHLEPIDIMQSYCHHTLQNTTLQTYLPHFHRAGVKQVLVASPLSMGLLRTAAGPAWHPASPALQAATRDAVAACERRGRKLEDVALGFGFTSVRLPGSDGCETPTVVGLSTPEEVHETMRVYHELYGAEGGASRAGRNPGEGLEEAGEVGRVQAACEKEVVEIFKKSGTFNWTWAVGV